MFSLETNRLFLRELSIGDADFICALMNDPDYIRFIGDRGVRNREDAINYLKNGPLASYREHGFGLNLVALKKTQTPIGICGLIKRDTLDDVDIGYGFLADYRGQGFAFEASQAVLAFGYEQLSLTRIVAIITPNNTRSIKLIGKLGFELEKQFTHGSDPCLLFARQG